MTVNSNDPEGLGYAPCYNIGSTFAGTPTDAALTDCGRTANAPNEIQITARFLTASTTISGGGGAAATSASQ
jgi:hypothetical protein